MPPSCLHLYTLYEWSTRLDRLSDGIGGLFAAGGAFSPHDCSPVRDPQGGQVDISSSPGADGCPPSIRQCSCVFATHSHQSSHRVRRPGLGVSAFLSWSL